MTDPAPGRMPFDIVGFDLDGTLLDTSVDLASATNHALRLAGRAALPIDDIRAMIGGGGRMMLAKGLEASGGLDEDELDRLYPELLDFYAENIATNTRPFPGVLDAIDTMASAGTKIAMVTNKVEFLTRKLLDALDLTARFDCIIGGDTLGPGRAKPSPAPILVMIERCGGGRAAFVGDSIFDVTAAKNARVPAIAVSFGFPACPIEELGADRVIDDYAELIPALHELACG